VLLHKSKTSYIYKRSEYNQKHVQLTIIDGRIGIMCPRRPLIRVFEGVNLGFLTRLEAVFAVDVPPPLSEVFAERRSYGRSHCPWPPVVPRAGVVARTGMGP
jgi:hypothetical protein